MTKPALVLALCGALVSPATSMAATRGLAEWSTQASAVKTESAPGPLVRAVEREASRLARENQVKDAVQPRRRPSPQAVGSNGILSRLGLSSGPAWPGCRITLAATAVATCPPTRTCSTAGAAVGFYPMLFAPLGALVGQVVALPGRPSASRSGTPAGSPLLTTKKPEDGGSAA